MKVLNLYAGIGGNRAKWPNHWAVTAVESEEKIAEVYRYLNPRDDVIETDAHDFLLRHWDEFDFIWSSPPCQTHSRMSKATRHKLRRYVDLRLYEQIMLLQSQDDVPWVVENVRPFYEPLIKPTFPVGRHLFWASSPAIVADVERPRGFINMSNMAGRKALQDWLGIHFPQVVYYKNNHCPAQILRNAVHPEIGRSVAEQVAACRTLEAAE